MPIKFNLSSLPSLPTFLKKRLSDSEDTTPLISPRLSLSSSIGSDNAAGPSPSGSSSSTGRGSVAGNTDRHDPVASPLPPRTVRVMSVGGGSMSTTPQTASSMRGRGVDMQERISSWVAEPVIDMRHLRIKSSDTMTKIGSLYSKEKITDLHIMKDPHGQGIVLRGTLRDPSIRPYGYVRFLYDPSRKGNPGNNVTVLSNTQSKPFQTAHGEEDFRPAETEVPAGIFFKQIS